MRSLPGVVLGFLLVAALAPPVGAGITDSPLPLVRGQRTKHVYTVAGVTAGAAGLETVFFCTSSEKSKDVLAAIEIFAHNGGAPANDVGAENGVDLIEPGSTSTFVTNTIGSFSTDEGIVPNGAIQQGSARILATSSKLVCSAHLVSQAGAPPATMTSLSIVKKASQKGD